MDAPVAIGDIVAGRFEVEGILGAGGMGVVVAARHRQLGHRVAIKFLSAKALGDLAARIRFEREAKVLATLKSDHVTRVFDIGALENGTPYIVMELLDGQDFATLLRRSGPLPVADALRWMLQVCKALAEAHRAGIVHRDLKPANIFLARRPDGERIAKVLDFGVSKAPSPADCAGLTNTVMVMGSPSYMSPEQVREAKRVDARSDVWSLGVTLYELLLGHVPYVSVSFGELCSMILSDEPVSLRELRASAPIDVVEVVARCLQKDPAARPPSAEALAFELSRCLRHAGPGAQAEPSWPAPPPPTAPDGSASEPGAPISAAPVSRTSPPRPRGWSVRKNSMILFAVAGALSVAILVVSMARRGPSPAFVRSNTSASDAPTVAPVSLAQLTTLLPAETAPATASGATDPTPPGGGAIVVEPRSERAAAGPSRGAPSPAPKPAAPPAKSSRAPSPTSGRRSPDEPDASSTAPATSRDFLKSHY